MSGNGLELHLVLWKIWRRLDRQCWRFLLKKGGIRKFFSGGYSTEGIKNKGEIRPLSELWLIFSVFIICFMLIFSCYHSILSNFEPLVYLMVFIVITIIRWSVVCLPVVHPFVFDTIILWSVHRYCVNLV